MSTATHWAAGLIGKPWKRGAPGPDAFDCWQLVRHVQLTRFGVEMPILAIGADTNWTGLRAMINRTQWGKAEGLAREGDVATMKGSDGAHVGVVINADGYTPVLLHCIGSESHHGGGVIVTTLAEIGDLGFARVEIWRLRPR